MSSTIAGGAEGGAATVASTGSSLRESTKTFHVFKRAVPPGFDVFLSLAILLVGLGRTFDSQAGRRQRDFSVIGNLCPQIVPGKDFPAKDQLLGKSTLVAGANVDELTEHKGSPGKRYCRFIRKYENATFLQFEHSGTAE
jgi:hypothetical protein